MNELKQKLAGIREALRSLGAQDELNEDQAREFDELFEEERTVSEQLAAVEAREARLADVRSRTIAIEPGEDRGVPNINTKTSNDPFDMSDVSVMTPTSQLRGRALDAIERTEHMDDTLRQTATETVERVGGESIGRVLATGTKAYRSAFQKIVGGQQIMLTGEERAALERAQSLTNADGGFAVPFTLDPTILLTNDGTINPLRRIARTTQISTDSWNGVSSAGATATYKAEAAQATDDAITLAQPSVPVHRLDVFIPYSYEVGGDWANIESDLLAVMNDAKGRAEATAFTTGSGTDEPTGFVTALDGTGSEVAPETAETFAVEDLYALEEALPPRFRAMARWGANRAIYNLVRQFGTSDSHALWERLGAGLPPALLGYSAEEISDMDSGFDAAATADNHILVIGDWSRFLIVDRVGMNVTNIPVLFGANQRPTGQAGFYAWCRNGSDVLTDDAFRILNVATTA